MLQALQFIATLAAALFAGAALSLAASIIYLWQLHKA
jgi:hypothetical protein